MSIVQKYTLGINEIFTLNSSSDLWYLESGKLLIYSKHSDNVKRFLYEISAGEIFFGTDLEEYSWEIEAVVLETSIIEAIPIANWCNDLSNVQKSIQLKLWLNKVEKLLQNKVPFASNKCINHTPKENEVLLELDKNEIIKAQEYPIWIKVEYGNLLFLGNSEIPINKDSGIVLLFENFWLKNIEKTKLKISAEPGFAEIKDLQKGLIFSHRSLYIFLINNELQEEEITKNKLQKKLEYDELLLEGVLKQFSELFERGSLDVTLSEQTPLLRAMGRVARSLGVSISPPKESEGQTSLKNPLSAIVRASRLQMRRVFLAGNWWQSDSGPLLAYWKNNEPVALIPAKKNTYKLYNPISEETVLVDMQVAENLSGIAFMFYKTLPDRPLKVWDILRFGFASNYWDFILILLCVVSATLVNMITPIMIGKLVNEVIPNGQKNELLQIGLFLFGCTFGVTLFQFTQGFTSLRLINFTDLIVQSAVWDRVLQLPARFFRDYTTGDLYSRIAGITQIFHTLNSATLSSILSSFFAILNLGLIFWYSWELAGLAVVVAFFSIVITFIHSWFIIRQNRELLNLEGNLSGKVFQLIKFINKIRVSGAEKRGFVYWAKDYRQRSKLRLNNQVTSDSLSLFNSSISSISTIALFLIAYWSMRPSDPLAVATLSVGNFMSANAAFGTFVSSATGLSNTLVGLLNVVNLWQRAEPILLSPLEVDRGKIDPGRLQGKILVDRVNFRYEQEKPLVLNDISLYAEPGEFIALVGKSGCGKSTLFRLLLGFENPESGAIYFDQKDLSKLNIQSVRRQFGVVLQTSKLQASSIFENISGGSLITLDEAWEAAKMAGFDQDIVSMPMQMNTVVSEGGSNLSGGQRQRLLITKALVLKPKIILFDEATSALDNNTQMTVTKSLEQLKVTRIVIAHRLSTIQKADRIYVIDQGRIIQTGNFEELSQQEGLFADLMRRQVF